MAMSEHQLITPRRSFLIRALGFTAAGATVSIPVLLADNPQKRVDYHLQELTKALQEQYPEAKLFGRARRWESWRGCTSPGDIIATVRAEDGPRLRCSRAGRWIMKTPAIPDPDWRRRHALNVAAMLPDDTADGLVVLDLAREFVVNFLQAGPPEPEKANPVVTLIRSRPDLSA
jgi:hypothetical protein